MTKLLQVEQLTKTFGTYHAANDVTFSIEEHTSTALIGPNGAGKTTTLSMLAGLMKPTSGTMIFQNEKKTDQRTLIGFLPQYPKFYPWLSALEFTEMAAQLSGVEKRYAKAEAQKTLEFVGLGDVLTKRTGTFSGGMKQRLGLAQAIVHKPKLLLLDEPVSALDPVGRRQVLNLLKELQQETTILYSTHILNDAEEMTDQLLFMRKGMLVESGSLEQVRERYAEPKIVIEFESTEHLNLFAKNVPWKLEMKNSIALIDVVAQQVTMQEVLQQISAQSYHVRKVEKQTASLEEIFMKVVQLA